MLIGKLDFNPKLKYSKLSDFKKFWKKHDFESKTGVSDLEAAKKLGIKVPKKNKEGDN